MLIYTFTARAGEVHISVDPGNQLYGDKVIVTAVVMGQSAVSYQWFKNNKALSTTTTKDSAIDGLGTSKLTISHFTHYYEGKYQCSVRFSSGEVVKSSHIELALGKYT